MPFICSLLKLGTFSSKVNTRFTLWYILTLGFLIGGFDTEKWPWLRSDNKSFRVVFVDHSNKCYGTRNFTVLKLKRTRTTQPGSCSIPWSPRTTVQFLTFVIVVNSYIDTVIRIDFNINDRLSILINPVSIVTKSETFFILFCGKKDNLSRKSSFLSVESKPVTRFPFTLGRNLRLGNNLTSLFLRVIVYI